MYHMNESIAVRVCEEKTFLINIYTNQVLAIGTDAYHYLTTCLEEGLTERRFKTMEPGFQNFVEELKQENILKGEEQ